MPAKLSRQGARLKTREAPGSTPGTGTHDLGPSEQRNARLTLDQENTGSIPVRPTQAPVGGAFAVLAQQVGHLASTQA